MSWAWNRDVSLAFALAAERYWLTIFPQVVKELHHWRRRANAIPDPVLRRCALQTHATKAAHAEGAAAFATLVPLRRRATVVRGLVTLQAMYDYLDTISEEPGTDRFVNGLQLHRALVAAVDPAAAPVDYYAFHSRRGDGGYLQDMIAVCQAVCGRLPGHALAAPALRRSTARAMESQGLVHSASHANAESGRSLAQWAESLGRPEWGLRWWELASAAGSSLGFHALLAAAADPSLDLATVEKIETLYFPWGGGLQGMLDSLIDSVEDREHGNFAYIAHYGSAAEARRRLGEVAERTSQLAQGAPLGHQHVVIVAGMVALYLSDPEAAPETAAAARHLLTVIGWPVTIALAILRLRRRAAGGQRSRVS
jgi:tetraprenyl-beta-curcumene synthase